MISSDQWIIKCAPQMRLIYKIDNSTALGTFCNFSGR